MPSLTIADDNKQFHAPLGSKILTICDKKGTSLIFGCRDGNCGSCLVEVLEGPENLSPKQPKESQLLTTIQASATHRLACQCQLLGDVVLKVVDYDES